MLAMVLRLAVVSVRVRERSAVKVIVDGIAIGFDVPPTIKTGGRRICFIEVSLTGQGRFTGKTVLCTGESLSRGCMQ